MIDLDLDESVIASAPATDLQSSVDAASKKAAFLAKSIRAETAEHEQKVNVLAERNLQIAKINEEAKAAETARKASSIAKSKARSAKYAADAAKIRQQLETPEEINAQKELAARILENAETDLAIESVDRLIAADAEEAERKAKEEADQQLKEKELAAEEAKRNQRI